MVSRFALAPMKITRRRGFVNTKLLHFMNTVQKYTGRGVLLNAFINVKIAFSYVDYHFGSQGFVQKINNSII